MSLNAHILNFLAADHFLNIDPQQLMVFILHPKPQGFDGPVGRAHRDHIYRTILPHRTHLLIVSFIIARLFVFIKYKFPVAHFLPI